MYFNPWSRKWQSTSVFSLGNPMDRGAWWAIVHGVAKSQTQLSNWACTLILQYTFFKGSPPHTVRKLVSPSLEKKMVFTLETLSTMILETADTVWGEGGRWSPIWQQVKWKPYWKVNHSVPKPALHLTPRTPPANILILGQKTEIYLWRNWPCWEQRY